MIKTIAAFFLLLLIASCDTVANDSGKEPVVIDVSKNKPAAVDDTAKNTATYKYDLAKPSQEWKLPDALVEVSGNTWVDANHLIFIEDLHPNLYYVKLEDKTATLEKTVSFAQSEKEKVDIEDVTIVNNVVYALWSHGILFKITDWQTDAKIEKIKTGLKKENNAEGLCYDDISKTLLIACKDGSGTDDEKKSAKAVYSFDMNKQELLQPPFMMIHAKDFVAQTGDKLHFNPSAIAVHPITHDIYMLTTRENKGMAVFTHDGKLISYQTINKEKMAQPEGICFSPDGKLYISSEGKKGAAGNVFEFKTL